MYNTTISVVICPIGSDSSSAAEISRKESRELRQSEGIHYRYVFRGPKKKKVGSADYVASIFYFNH